MLASQPKPPDGRPGHQRSTQRAVVDAEAMLGKWAKVSRSRFVGRIVIEDRPALQGIEIKDKDVGIIVPNVGGILGNFEHSKLGFMKPQKQITSNTNRIQHQAAVTAACTVVVVAVLSIRKVHEDALICRAPVIKFPPIMSISASATVIASLIISVSTHHQTTTPIKKKTRRLVETAVANTILTLPGKSSFLMELTKESEPPPIQKPKAIKKKVRLNALPTVTWHVADEVDVPNSEATSAVVQIDPVWAKNGTPRLAIPSN